MSKTHGICDNCGEDVSSLARRIWWKIRAKFRKKPVLVVCSLAGQTADLAQFQDSTGKVIARMGPDGRVEFS